MKTDQILVERTFDVPVNQVWTAITDNKALSKWYFNLAAFEPEVGFKFDFLGGPEDGTQYLHLCEVTEVIEGEKIAYTWRYDNYPGNSVVTWELIDKGEKTILRLTHQGAHTFEEAGKDFSKASFTEGWNYIVHTSLKEYLEREE